MSDETEGRARQRFISLIALARGVRSTFERFPLVLLSATTAAVLFHHLFNIDFDADEGADFIWPIVATSALGIPLFFSLRLLGESRDWTRRWRTGIALAGLAALVLYYLSLPVPMKEADVFRFFALAAGLHLWVAFAPFARRASDHNAFWQYNKVLFLRFALAALYSAVLYIGLTLAIASANALLDLEIDEKIYGQLWFWVVFLYNTWFFLAGIPEDVRELEHETSYPTGLRIFTQYALIPLVVIYMFILYAYLVKILIEWDLPKGWVGYPVIGFSVTGILALLLVYPIRERAENAWIVTYSKFFYWALFPLIGLIAVAIGTRIADYGITERRYAVVIATLWLFGIALYYTIRGSRDIKLIPVTLCLLAFFTATGPWGAVANSWRSQTSRLRELLINNEVLTAGVVDATPKQVAFDQEKEIGNILKYLHDTHGLSRLRGWYAEPERLAEDLDFRGAMREMGLEYRPPWEGVPSFAVVVEPPNPVSVVGHDYYYHLSDYFAEEGPQLDRVLDGSVRFQLEGSRLSVSRTNEPDQRLSVDLGPMIRHLIELRKAGRGAEPDDATLAAEDERFKLVVHLANANGSLEGDTLSLTYVDAHLLIGLK